jgi:hypothetical protein
MAEQNVNATSGNKKVLIGPRRFSRMNSPKHGSEGKTLFRCRAAWPGLSGTKSGKEWALPQSGYLLTTGHSEARRNHGEEACR